MIKSEEDNDLKKMGNNLLWAIRPLEKPEPCTY